MTATIQPHESTPKLIIKGSKHPLKGIVRASGAKNAVLPILAATILCSDIVTLHNVPQLQDVITLTDLLCSLGAKVEINGETVIIDPRGIDNIRASHELVKLMRASILVLGPILARFGKAEVSLPGGCAIGSRPVDQHLKGLEALGASISLENGYVHAYAPQATAKLKGGLVMFDMVTVTGTENIIMAAVLACGVSVIENCAREPEVTDLVKMLVKFGAKIEGIGTEKLTITGVQKLSGGEYQVMPDRIEIGTYLCAAVLTHGDITIENCEPEHQEMLINKLRKTGALINVGKDFIHIVKDSSPILPVNIKTAPYPAFPTDMQAQFMVVNALANGSSTVVETIFENRFMHVEELARMGANIRVEGNTSIIAGVKSLSGAEVSSTDLRASACLVIAALVAEGTTTIDNIYHLDRGYANIEAKLSALGADIKRV